MQPHQAAAQGFKWWPWVVLTIILAVGTFVALYVTVLAPAGNVIDAANQHNQVRHLHRQQAVQNAQNQVTYGSIGFQDGQISEMHQNISNITGPAGLALTRAGLSASDPEQQTLQASEDDQVNSLCAEGAKVAPNNPSFTSGSPSLKDLYAANCTAGTAVANPPLAQNPIPHGGA
jgi:hypothetical protein